MVRVFIAGLIAMVVSVVIGPKFIEFLRRNELGQPIREDGPAGHVVKQGTPVMGGLLILLCALLPFLALSKFTLPALTVLFVTVACGAVGFLDDFIKLRHRRSLGLRGRWKMAALVAITIGVSLAHSQIEELDRSLYIPIVDVDLSLSYAFYPVLFLVIAGTVNGVNLTDGLDGLAAGTSIIALLTFLSMVVIAYIRSGPVGGRSDDNLDLAILGAALIGGTIGFLWYNAAPAELFMGDTGAMALGGALAGFAIMTDTEILLLLIGGIFAIEALSVIVQVVSFKYFGGRRPFLIAPIHHHFEMKAWSDTKIMVRFWILGAIVGASAFGVYYQYFGDYFQLIP
jgi:phospho-N-acetylmuramoyl-pentapeptide-transferase